MNFKLKVKLYQKQGMSLVDAQEKVINEASKTCEDMDQKLSKCMSYLNQDQMLEIFGDFKDD